MRRERRGKKREQRGKREERTLRIWREAEESARAAWVTQSGGAARRGSEKARGVVRRHCAHVGVAPYEGTKLEDGDEAREVGDLDLWVAIVLDAAEVEELTALVDVRPEALLELLLRPAEGSRGGEGIEMAQHADDAWEAVDLAHVEELKGLHLEAEAAVHHEEREVGDLCNVAHRVHVVGALDQRDAPLLAGDDRHRTDHGAKILLGPVLDQRLNERRLAHAWRADDGDDERRRHDGLLCAIDEIDVVLLFLLLERAVCGEPHGRGPGGREEGLWVVALVSSPAVGLLAGNGLLGLCAALLLRHGRFGYGGGRASGPAGAP